MLLSLKQRILDDPERTSLENETKKQPTNVKTSIINEQTVGKLLFE